MDNERSNERFNDLRPLTQCPFCTEPTPRGANRYDTVLGRAPGTVVQYVSACSGHRKALNELSGAFNAWSVEAWARSLERASQELDERIRNAPFGEDDIPF